MSCIPPSPCPKGGGHIPFPEPTPQEDRHDSRSAWLQVLGAFCLNVNTWGLLGSYGVYQTYYSLHLLHEFSASEISWIGSVQGFFMFLVSFFIGPVFDGGYLRSLLWVGSTLSVLGFFMTSLCTRYWQCFLAQGVAMGIGFGCLYLPAPALVSMHFQRHQALAMGLSSSGSGIGAVVFPLVFNQLEPHIGFGWATRVLAFILLATSVIPLVLMRFPTPGAPGAEHAGTSHEPHGQDAQPLDTNASASFTRVLRNLPNLVDASALRDAPFAFLLTGLLTTFMGIYTILYYVNLLAMQRTTAVPSVSSSILVIVNGASTVGRIAPSALADRVGPAHVLGAMALFSGILVLCSLLVSSGAGIIVWAVVFGSTAGAFMGLPAAGIVSVSNSRTKIGVRLGMTLGTVGCGVLVAEPIAGAILGHRNGGWPGLVAWSGSLMLVGFIFVAAARVAKVGWKFTSAV